MIRVKKVEDEKGALYIPDDFEGYSEYNGEEYCLVKEDELDTDGKAYVDLVDKIRKYGLKSLTEKEKSENDQFGYKLLRVYKKIFNNNGFSDREAYVVKKSASKYSLKLPLAFVAKAIKKDIEENYNGVMDAPYKTEEIIYFHKHYEDLMTSPSSEIHKYIEYLNGKGLDITDPVVLGIEELTTNSGAGCYEVAYWATGEI